MVKRCFIFGFSPHLEDPKVQELIPLVLNSDVDSIGINRFPQYHKGCKYWWVQDMGAVALINLYHSGEKIICPQSCINKLVFPLSAYKVFEGYNEFQWGKTGVSVERTYLGLNSSLACCNIALNILDADEVILVGIDLPLFWTYPYGEPPSVFKIRTAQETLSLHGIIKQFDEIARGKNKRILKTNSENDLDLEYKSVEDLIMEYRHLW